ncbi:MAG: LysM peptidoglycan-binding domain-containing protein [Sphingomonadaceae bacterium]|nr:LysM peptidoglycan-binding domain-containing protein [Sphingomonadaceae bacterium]
MIRSRLLLSAACGLALALAACGPSVAPHPETPAAKPAKRGPIDQAIAALQDGKEKDAARELARILKKNPNDGEALLLRNSIERDPAALLPGESYPYVVRSGDTMMSIAERYLGSALKFYALARYNHIAVPSSLVAGQLLRVPSAALRPKPVVVAPPPEKAEEAPKPEPKSKKKATPAAAPAPTPGAPAAPAAAAHNPALAARMRGAGLAALAQGNVARAVVLLSHAAALDPANPLIQRDLARAQRIQSTVQAKH